MVTMPRRVLEWIRQPEYTGENRCLPCTGVNLVIALVFAGVIAVFSTLAGVLVLLFSLVAIYVRGYLVPGTPTLTKRYFPDWLLARFDKEPIPQAEGRRSTSTIEDGNSSAGQHNARPERTNSSPEATPPDPTPASYQDGVDPEAIFLEHEVLEPCADEDDLCVVDGVSEQWRAEIETVREGDRREQVAEYLDVDSDLAEITTYDQRTEARVDGRLAAWWESEAALIADLASETVLGSVIDDWESWSLPERSQLAGGMRAFVETCPSCDGPISIGEETVESCCRSHEIYAVTCEDCDARILEVTPPS